MDQGVVIDLAQRAMRTIFMVASPILGFGLVVGLAVSIFQATTSIQEQTLAFILKIVAILCSILIFGPWMLRILIEFAEQTFLGINQVILK